MTQPKQKITSSQIEDQLDNATDHVERAITAIRTAITLSAHPTKFRQLLRKLQALSNEIGTLPNTPRT